jgi:hypothetical protein
LILWSAHRFYAWPSGELSWNFEVALRVYLLDEDEFVRERKHQKILVDEDVELNHARKRVEFIVNLATMLLSAYPTTLDEDRSALQQIEERHTEGSDEAVVDGSNDDDEQQLGRKKRRKNDTTRNKVAEPTSTTGLWARRCALVLRIGRKQILTNVLHRARNDLAQFA